ncbi:MAG: hypothetical protein ACXVZP_10500 [Gaiellaceae bacterium]
MAGSGEPTARAGVAVLCVMLLVMVGLALVAVQAGSDSRPLLRVGAAALCGLGAITGWVVFRHPTLGPPAPGRPRQRPSLAVQWSQVLAALLIAWAAFAAPRTGRFLVVGLLLGFLAAGVVVVAMRIGDLRRQDVGRRRRPRRRTP